MCVRARRDDGGLLEFTACRVIAVFPWCLQVVSPFVVILVDGRRDWWQRPKRIREVVGERDTLSGKGGLLEAGLDGEPALRIIAERAEARLIPALVVGASFLLLNLQMRRQRL